MKTLHSSKSFVIFTCMIFGNVLIPSNHILLLILVFWLTKCQKWLIFVFSEDDSKKVATIWAKYLSALERSFLALSDDSMVKRL